MYLLRSGVLSNTEAARRQVKGILATVKAVPKCAGCMFGKQKRLPSPGTKTHVVKEKSGALKENHLKPGDEASVDHFYCSVRGRLFNSKGKTREENMYSGGLMVVDQATNHVFVHFQTRLTSQETLEQRTI